MKYVLAIAAALGLSISAASAECNYHSKVSASVDSETKTASIQTDQASVPADAAAQTVKKETKTAN
ncbi:hypothetical protein ABFT80_02885 [Mesorhizobium sp. SB112]|uniref:hypothetical protein n=1 Tax=Mesorhizobium sp. SB112 TaxID=3151853 RepID=UPI0032674039